MVWYIDSISNIIFINQTIKDKEVNMNETPVEKVKEQPAREQAEVDIWHEILDGFPEWLRTPIQDYARQIIAGIVIVLLGALLFTGYNTYRFRQESSAATAFGLAMSARDPVVVAEGMQKVIKEHAGTKAADLALLLLGAAQRDAGDMLHATENFNKAVQTLGKDSVAGQSALMGAAYVAEIQGDNKKALEGYDVAIKDQKGFETIAMSDKARVLAAMGRHGDALACYEKIIDSSPGSQDLGYIRYQVMKLSSSK